MRRAALPPGAYFNVNSSVFLHVILNDSEESHRRTDGHIFFSLKSWDISLTLNMT